MSLIEIELGLNCFLMAGTVIKILTEVIFLDMENNLHQNIIIWLWNYKDFTYYYTNSRKFYAFYKHRYLVW